jgi:hypothetical protein
MNVFWNDDEKIVLVREFPKHWTWEDYQASVELMRQMLQDVEHDVFVIIDARQIQWLPKGSSNYFKEGNRNIPPHVMMRIIVSENALVQALVSILQRAAPSYFKNFYWVASMEEAHQKIARAQASRG